MSGPGTLREIERLLVEARSTSSDPLLDEALAHVRALLEAQLVQRLARESKNGTRDVLVWSLWRAGCSTAAIAEELGTTKGTVGVLMVRLRRRGWPLEYRYLDSARPVVTTVAHNLK
jgi:CRP-like cAMP-binding protein